MKYFMMFVIVTHFRTNITGGTVSRSLCALPPSGGYCDTFIAAGFTLPLPNRLSVHDCVQLALHSYVLIQVRLCNIPGQLVTISADGNYPAGARPFCLSEDQISARIHLLSVITPGARAKIIYLREYSG